MHYTCRVTLIKLPRCVLRDYDNVVVQVPNASEALMMDMFWVWQQAKDQTFGFHDVPNIDHILNLTVSFYKYFSSNGLCF